MLRTTMRRVRHTGEPRLVRHLASGIPAHPTISPLLLIRPCLHIETFSVCPIPMGSRVTRAGDLVCRVRGLPVLMTVRRIRDSDADQGTTTGTGMDAAALISCAHIGPTIVPARMNRGVVDGGEFGEKVAHFLIV